MRKNEFSDEQIIAILNQAESTPCTRCRESPAAARLSARPVDPEPSGLAAVAAR